MRYLLPIAALLAVLSSAAHADCTALTNGVIPVPTPYLDDTITKSRALAAASTGFAASEGAIAYDTTNDILKVCDGTVWQSLSGGSVSADSLDFTEFKDAMTLDASTDIAASGTNVLSITNTGTGNSFLVNDAASDTTPFVIDASGKVGIGTNAALSQSLVVAGDQSTSGYLRVGSATAPTNTTAGDLTVTRLNVGNTNFSGTGFASMTGTITDTTSSINAVNISAMLNPASSNTGQLRALTALGVYQGTAIDYALGYGVMGINEFRSTGNVSNTLAGVIGTGTQLTTNSVNFGTINNSTGVLGQGVISIGANTVTGTITQAVGLRVLDSIKTTQAITGNAGLVVPALSAGTNNSAVILGQVTVPSGNYAIYSAVTDNSYFAGKVGIGTVSPSVVLESKTTTSAIKFRMTDESAPDAASSAGLNYYEFYGNGVRSGYMGYSYGSLDMGIGNELAGAIRLYTATTEKMRIDSNGNVGIGTVSPTTALTVGTAGTITVQNGGSVSAPAFAVTTGGLGTSGLYVPTANSVALVASGAEKMRIMGDGRIFIGDDATDNATFQGGLLNRLTVRATAQTYTVPSSGAALVLRGASSGTNANSAFAYYGHGGYGWAMGLNADAGTAIVNGDGNDFVLLNTAYTTPTPALTVLSSGNVGIGTTGPNAKLEILASQNASSLTVTGGMVLFSPSISSANQGVQIDLTNLASGSNSLFFNAPTGWTGNFISANLNGSQKFRIDQNGLYTQSSDSRLKRDIKPIENALDRITSINGVTYHWKDSSQGVDEQVGVIAQDVEKVFPQLVTTDKGYKGVNYSGLVAPLIEAIKELKAANDNQVKRFDALDAEFEAYKATHP